MFDPAQWRVSAIIPAYNRGDLLAETINCLLGQTTPPDEIVVIDDGSTDDTPAVAAGFGDKIRYKRIDNSGAPVARNVGAAMATGDWLWFCDSDDLWRPQYLERARAIAATAPYPEFIFGNFSLVHDGVWETTAKFDTAPSGFWQGLDTVAAPGGLIFREPLYPRVLTFQPVFHSTILMSRAFFETVGGYDPTFARTGSEDFEFTLRCVGRAPIGMIQEALVGIRRHGGNFSGNHLRCLLGEVDILRHAKASHAAAARLGPQMDAEISRRTLDALGQAFACDDYGRVTALARDLKPGEIDMRSRFKVFLAGNPPIVRDTVVALARLKNPSAAPR